MSHPSDPVREPATETPPPPPSPSTTSDAKPKPNIAVSTVQEKLPDCSITASVPKQAQAQAQAEDYDPTLNAKPYSPFYRHATPSSRLESISETLQTNKRSRSVGVCTSPIDEVDDPRRATWQRLGDDEAQTQTQATNSNSNSTYRASKLWVQERRHCDCLRGLSRTQRVLVKAAIATAILGCMVAVALGITAAVGGGVWKSDHQLEW